ncbi:MAG: hypothetical protein NTV01_01570, partial [Bacteroidia bacterium]|nr:hypothetical protein [Bacteroidia bacterium]
KIDMLKTWMTLPVITLAVFLLSCNIINPAEDIPSYIKVDTILVKVTKIDQRSASHNMTCVKLNVGGTTLGFFEIPTMVPCLITGKQSLYLEPGFDLNGISGSRTVYPFFKPFTDTARIDFVPGKVITIKPITTYKDECKFPWTEDFEDAGLSFEYPTYSDTIFRSQTETVREGLFSGAIYLDTNNRFFEAYSGTDYELPNTGSMVLLEFDYLSNTLLEVGVYVLQGGAAAWNSLVIVRPSDHWNRIYIDLTTTIGDNPSAESFRPGFRAGWDSTGLAKQAIIMDNIKLIHF